MRVMSIAYLLRNVKELGLSDKYHETSNDYAAKKNIEH